MEKNHNFLDKVYRFLIAFVKHTISGSKNVENAVYLKRLKTCFGCDDIIQNKGVPTCGNCGCKILLKAKWAEQECPKKYWEKYE